MTQNLLSVIRLLIIGIILLTTFLEKAQGQSCYAYCPQCQARLGGPGRIGPFSSKDECEKYRKQETDQGFPFGPCECSGPGNATASGANPGSTGSLAGDMLNLGANLWIAQNVKNPYTATFMSSVSQSFLTSFFANRAEAQRQQELMNRVLLKRQQEAMEKARIAEQQRIDALFTRLNHELKFSGSPTYLALKTSGDFGELPLKLSSNSQADQGLHLKLGSEEGQGTGINGLPGIYLGGPAKAMGANADTEGLKLKFDDSSAAKPSTANLPVAPGGGMGIPGLPSIYLNDVPPERAADLANVATNLSGPERQVAEDAALAAAQKNRTLTGPSDDPFVVAYQNDAQAYAEALKAQQDAWQKAVEAEGHAQASRAVVDYIGTQVGSDAQTEAQKQAFQQISLSAGSDEALAFEARRMFEQTDIRLSVARDRAAGALSGLMTQPPNNASEPNNVADTTPPRSSSTSTISPAIGSSSVVDLSKVKLPPTPAILAMPPAGGTPVKETPSACLARVLAREGQRPVFTQDELHEKLESASRAYQRLVQTETSEDEERAEWLKEMSKAVIDLGNNAFDFGMERIHSSTEEAFKKAEARIERASVELETAKKDLQAAEPILHDEIMKTKDEAIRLHQELAEVRAARDSTKDPSRLAQLNAQWSDLEKNKIPSLLEKRKALYAEWGEYYRRVQLTGQFERRISELKQGAEAFNERLRTFKSARDFWLWITDTEDPLEIGKNNPIAQSNPPDKSMDWNQPSDIYWKSGPAFEGLKQLIKICFPANTPIGAPIHTASMLIDVTYDVTAGYLGYQRLKQMNANSAQFEKGKAALAHRIQRLESELECYQGYR